MQDPEEIWRWTTEFKKVQGQNKANVSHHAIAGLQVYCKEKPEIMKCSVITQNIDAYHIEALEKARTKKKEAVVPVSSKSAVKSSVKPAQSTLKKPMTEKKNVVSSTKITASKGPVKKKIESPKNSKEAVKTQMATLRNTVEESKASDNNNQTDQGAKESERRVLEGLCENIYEIHGNIDLMRCDNECQVKVFPISYNTINDSVPKCPNCQGVAR